MNVLARWLRVVVVGLPLIAQAQEELEQEQQDEVKQDEQEKRQVMVSACEFDRAGPKSRGQLIETESEVCGASMCSTFGTVGLGLEGAKPLVEVNLTSGLLPGGGNPLPTLRVECAPGRVRLHTVTKPKKSWDVLGVSPPPDKTAEGTTGWESTPLASPDQQWVLRLASDASCQRVLWLGKLEPVAPRKLP